jgi:DsbC/DsbD-like thiol-disulfide interchange protein
MNMIRLLTIFLLLHFSAFAQSDKKVSWEFTAVKKDKNQFEIRLTANIAPGWHLYSQQQPADAIALPTAIQFAKHPLIERKGVVKEEGKLIDQVDPATRSRSRYYAGTVTFIQLVQLKKTMKTTISGDVEFMVCDDKQCLPPGKVKFSVKL